MPEFPDIELYRDRLAARLVGATCTGLRLRSPFLLRSVEPPPDAFLGRTVVGVERLGKQLVIAFAPEGYMLLHLMVAGRLHWKAAGASPGGRSGLAAFDFSTGTLVLTESSTKKRASLRCFADRAGLATRDPGGVDPSSCTPEAFERALRRERHTLKRALTDQRVMTGIGNAYSDEILFHARLSPFRLSTALDDAECARLHATCVRVLNDWARRLATLAGDGFPSKVTAFQPDMAVHGRYREPCRDCGAPIQRVRYAANEANYCARCQTAGKVLADRSLSRLLKDNWPRRIEDLEG